MFYLFFVKRLTILFSVTFCVRLLCCDTISLSAPLQSVWVRKGPLRWWRDWKPQRWVDVGVALEQSTKCDGRKDSIFFVYYTQYDEKKVGFGPWWCF